MFSKFTAFLQQAAEVTSQVLAPQTSKHEDFESHWKAVIEATSIDSDDCTIHSTGVGTRLTEMMDILCREEEERNPRDPGTMGPCMEFVLRHKILDTLHTLGKSDYPTGMSHQVLLFFTVILGRIERPILHNVSIHQPILKQVHHCGHKLSKKQSVDEVHFIQTLCVRLQRDLGLADFFIDTEKKSSKKQFVIANALLRLVHSEDNVVVMKAYDCLLTCVSLQHTAVTEALAAGQLPVHLASQLQYHVQLVPTTAHTAAILGCQAGWGIDYATRSHTVDHSPETHGLWHVEAFLSWLDFCEQIVGVAQETLANVVCSTIHEMLLSASLLPKLVKFSEESILVSTAMLAKSIQTLNCRKLLEEFLMFALKERCDLRSKAGSPLLIDTLISRIDHHSYEVCQVTLQLFDVLLSSPLPCVVQELFLSHWSPHTTHTSSTPVTTPTTHSSPTPVTVSPLRSPALGTVPPEELTSVKKDMEEQMKDYLSLLPENLLSCEQVSGGLGLEQYLIEAHQQVAHCRAISASLSENTQDSSLSVTPTSSLELSPPISIPPPSSSQPLAEGPLLTTLLNKLERLLDQSYEANLLLTSILSRLASFSHPMIDWLYSSHSKHRGRNIFSTLMKLSSDLQSHAERSPGLVVNIVEARRRLSGMETSDLLSMPHNDLLEGAIVLEEFSKEMASIFYAKTTSALLSLPPPNL